MKNDEYFIEKNLPNKLTQEETIKYFKKYQNGDNSAREIIIKSNIKLVIYQVLKHFNYDDFDTKDLISTGIVGLIKSVDTYDLTRNTLFSTYASKCICTEIIMYLRKETKYNTIDSIDKPYDTTDNNHEKIQLIDTIKDENIDLIKDYERKEIYSILRSLINELSSRDKEIVTLYFGFNNDTRLTTTEISQRLNLAQSYIVRIIQKILNNLRKELQKIDALDYYKIKKRKKRTPR